MRLLKVCSVTAAQTWNRTQPEAAAAPAQALLMRHISNGTTCKITSSFINSQVPSGNLYHNNI